MFQQLANFYYRMTLFIESIWTSVVSHAKIVLLFIIIIIIWMSPQNMVSIFLPSTGEIYVSSPAVYTRERLVNDRNDQDFWLRSQLKSVDKANVGFSLAETTKRIISIIQQKDEGRSSPDRETQPTTTDRTQPNDSQTELSFQDILTQRSEWRDKIREAILENLLDDRHDLTGNSVYGLKFDTTAYPSWWTSGRAFVRISITSNEADWQTQSVSKEDKFPDLPSLLKSFYKTTYSDINNNIHNVNYTSYKLFSKWLKNLEWRMNSHFFQITQKKCIDEKEMSYDWTEDLLKSADTVLASTQAKLASLSTYGMDSVILPSPWQNFMFISLSGPKVSACSSRPLFLVHEQQDVVSIYHKDANPAGFELVEPLDDVDALYRYAPSDKTLAVLYSPHYRNFGSIVRYLKSINYDIIKICDDYKIKNNNYDKLNNNEEDECERYVTIYSGYFNFIESVLKADMYAYSLFPKSEGSPIRISSSNRTGLDQGLGGIWSFFASRADLHSEARLKNRAVGFTDASTLATERPGPSVDFGWSLEVGSAGSPSQKSQFALISVPAWTSRLAVTVRTSWGSPPDIDDDARSYRFYVPIPPDYEAFDGFIAGEEVVRRPQISAELMETQKVKACSKAVVLIPGLRLWRSAMVTLGSTRASRITVLPNMGGIIAEFADPGLPVMSGDTTLRVWTSEGVDSQLGKVKILPPDNLADCRSDDKAPINTADQGNVSTRDH